MFKKYLISLQYFDTHINVSILKYTGIRYNTIDFIICTKDNKYIWNDKNEKYMKEYHILNLIKNRIKFTSIFEDYDQNQKNLENFEL